MAMKLPDTWSQTKDGNGTFLRINPPRGVDALVASYNEMVAWVLQSEWRGFTITTRDYALTKDKNYEFRYPYVVQLSKDKNTPKPVPALEPVLLRYGRDGCERTTVCHSCGCWGPPVELVGEGAQRMMLCPDCNPKCRKCGKSASMSLVYTGELKDGNRAYEEHKMCKECAPVINCVGCNKEHHDTEFMKEVSIGGKACQYCRQRFSCKECKTFFPKGKGLTGTACNNCYAKKFDNIIKGESKFEIGSLPAGGLLFPKLPARPFRTISIETEVDGNKQALSGVLYACGLIQNPRVEDYNSYADHSAAWMCHLKHDGTVTGGELITHLLDLEDKDHADAFIDVLRRLRGLEKAGEIQYNSNCGGHIHIDAHNFDWNDVWRLYTIYGYMEDVLYRLAGSGASYGHRSLDKGRRTPNGARVGEYSLPIPKGPFGSLENFKTAVAYGNNRPALSLQHYMQAIGNCVCVGGRHGKLKNCSCNLGKATIEWRLWNSTGNPRILHAWIAIMQAMHSYCEQDIAPSEEWLNQYPAFAYTGGRWQSTSAAHKNTAKQRISWMLREFVFTPEERKSILYAIQKSEMEGLFDVKERNAWLRMESQDLPPKKMPRCPVRRERKIIIPQRTPEQMMQAKKPLADPNDALRAERRSFRPLRASRAAPMPAPLQPLVEYVDEYQVEYNGGEI